MFVNFTDAGERSTDPSMRTATPMAAPSARNTSEGGTWSRANDTVGGRPPGVAVAVAPTLTVVPSSRHVQEAVSQIASNATRSLTFVRGIVTGSRGGCGHSH